jgi:hypothetical protein
MLQRYREWSPTSFDRAGLNGEQNGIADYLVMPTMRSRDSEAIELSNFEVALDRLGGESEKVQVHQFGHWACGWFEIILVHPDRAPVAQNIVDELESYPVLDDDHHSQTEFNLAAEAGYELGPNYGWIHPDYPDEIVDHF